MLIFCQMTIIEFSEWLQDMLTEKQMKPKTLADKAGLDPGIISRVLNRERMPSSDSLSSIARALDLPPETVFRAAGLLPELPSIDQARMEIFLYKFAELPPEKQEQVLEYMDFIQKRNIEPVKPNREGVAPPETVKGKVRT